MSLYVPMDVKINSIMSETRDTKTFVLDYTLKHDPGQFVQVSVLGVGEVPISIASYSENYLELCIRNVGNVTNAIHQLEVGDKVGVRGPYGHGYPMQKMKDKDIVVVAGGTGVAAVRSVVEYLEKNRRNYHDISIFLGFRTPEDVLFEKDIARWGDKFNVNLTVDKSCEGWTCNVGLVTNILEKAPIDSGNAVAITCGPPIMLKSVIKVLQDKGFTDDQIYLSLERLMNCGVRKCGHCMIKSKYVCHDGPVFKYSEAKSLED